MTIRTSTITALAILAFVAPATAGAALAKPAAKKPPVHPAKVTLAAHPSAAVSKVKPSSTSTSTAPIVINFPAAAPVVLTQEQICETYGNGCTAEQYCEIWNINCAAVTNSGDDSNVDASSADSQSSDGSSATVLDPADLLAQDAEILANLEQEYCCDAGECSAVTS